MKTETLNPAELRAAGYKALAAALGPLGMTVETSKKMAEMIYGIAVFPAACLNLLWARTVMPKRT